MSVNPDRSEGLNICLKHQEKLPILTDNKEIKDVETHKHLGLVFSSAISSSIHLREKH
jgi:hypothetical protein